MRNKLNLEQKLSLGHRLMPLQLQFGQMLELNSHEIEELIKMAADENPALEIIDQNDNNVAEDSSPQREYFYSRSGATGDNQWDNYSEEQGQTLYEAVMNHVNDYNINKNVELAAEYIAGNLDSNGYITRTKAGIADDIAFQEGKEISEDDIDRAWELVRSVEPAGIGATDLRDCLILQLERRKEKSEAEKNALLILKEQFSAFSNRNFEKISEGLSLSKEEVKEAIDAISKLNPKPGRQFVSSKEEETFIHVTPDFIVLPDPDHPTNLLLSSTTELPELAIAKSFRFDDDENVADLKLPENIRKQRRETAYFAAQKREEAQNFAKLVKMRGETLWRIMNAIIRLQKDFFLTGEVSRLKPMLLKDISTITGDDLSVISRATSGKYVQTVSGIHSLKSLFGEVAGSGKGEEISSRQLELILQRLIDGEDKKNPLTDDELTRLVNNEGIEIARRTIAKYREKMSIPTARLRKEL